MSAAYDLTLRLDELKVPIFTAPAGTDTEFVRPNSWSTLTADGNAERIAAFNDGDATCAVMGGVVVVVDVDPRNGGDVDAVRTLLAELGVVVFAEIATPGRGRHFYIAGHPDLPTVHGTADRPGLAGYLGVDVQSHGSNVFLPGTRRPKYDGRGYQVVYDNLSALGDGGDPDGAESFTGWVAEHRTVPADPYQPAPPWDGTPPDSRQQAYLSAALTRQAEQIAAMPADSGRNTALYTAALKCGSYVAGAGLDEAKVLEVLTEAATSCGLVRDDGASSVAATIRSGLRNGRTRPRAVPPPTGPNLDELLTTIGTTAQHVTLGDVVAATRLLHHVVDDGPIRFALAVAVSSVLDQEPLWGMHVGPPSSGKTVTQELLGVVADDQIDELTVAGLLTWAKGGKRGAPARPVGLLARIGERGFATIGDFSTVLAGSDHNGRDQLFSDLRRVYDGSFSRNMDSPDGQPLRWSGRLTLLAAVTPAIDRYSAHSDALGPRWLYIRTDVANTGDKRAAARKARRRHHAGEQRKAIRAAASTLVAAARGRVADVDLSDDAHEALDDAALVACWGRASVPRQTWGRREVDGVAVIEEPPRLVRQLVTLARCMVALGEAEQDAVDLARRCALDTVPAARRDCLRHLSDGVEATVSQIAKHTRHHRDVIRRALEDLQIVGLTTCPAREDAELDHDDPHMRTAPAPWSLHGDDGELTAAVVNAHRRAEKRRAERGACHKK